MSDNLSSDLSFEYHCAKAFYRSNEGKAFKLGYDEKLRFIALSKQVAKGPYDPERMDGSQDSSMDTSYFNLVGNDRKAAWQKLGNLAKEDAMMAFVKELRDVCALFEPWYKAHLKIEAEKRKRENGSLLDSSLYDSGAPGICGNSDGNEIGDYTNGKEGHGNTNEVGKAGGSAGGLSTSNVTQSNSKDGNALMPEKSGKETKNGEYISANTEQQSKSSSNSVGNIDGKNTTIGERKEGNNSVASQNSALQSQNSHHSIPTKSAPNTAATNAVAYDYPPTNAVLSSATSGTATIPNSDNLSHINQIEQQKALIKNVLNTQTFQQFKQYAVSRYPQDEKEQEKLISELQEQHFQQYMQHIYFQQIAHLKAAAAQNQSINVNNPAATLAQTPTQQNVSMTSNSSEENFTQLSAASKLSFEKETKSTKDQGAENPTTNAKTTDEKPKDSSQKTGKDSSDPEKALGSPTADNLLVANPSMWTNKNMKEFKDLVKKDSNLVIRVGRGELVTIRVPTHEDGSFLFWEFATDHYDIGFGLHFEWTISPTNEITITAEEPDEDEDDEVVDSGNPNDVEKMQHFDSDGDKPALDVIAPIFRRDSHMEVQAGSHEYPGQGCYLLKFDNTFSLFRGKTLYYRVYYTK
ncbi:Golgi resident protein GCP60-like [Convolutriloba macropyga]|uniref:Golgi resident protein GCP60-like n=1 Tax=Convolutriloba macropyga TaxID=536237 RepID=UPI003F524484